MTAATEVPQLGQSGNLTGIVAMLASMAAFVANDTCVKTVGAHLPLGEVIVMRNSLATAYTLLFAAFYGGLAWPAAAPMRLVGWRTFGEIFSTIFFLSGLIALPIADATAIGQSLPLAITAAAAIVLKERVGMGLWIAMVVGLFGVLLIVRPGTSAFSPYALSILAAVGLVALRDLATRQIGRRISTVTLTLLSSVCVVVSGLLLLPFETWIWPSAQDICLLLAAGVFLAVGYALSVVAMIHGEVAVVSPFRYSVILYALVIGWVVWGDWPDAIQLAGIAILTLAGLYTLHHQRTQRRNA